MTFGCNFCLELGIGIGDWDGGGIGDLDLEWGIGDWNWGFVMTFGHDFSS